MSIAEIETALTELHPEDLERVEALVRELQALRTSDIEELEQRNGFSALPRRSNVPVTSKDVDRLCEEEGI